jgi:hypothetical protein
MEALCSADHAPMDLSIRCEQQTDDNGFLISSAFDLVDFRAQ